MTPYIDYRLVPNSTDEAAVLADLQAVSPKFKLDGVAVAATFDIEIDGDPKAAILAVSKKFNVSVMRVEWGHRPDVNLTEGMIERMVESKINGLDRRFMNSDMNQDEYDSKMREIREWADGQYRRIS